MTLFPLPQPPPVIGGADFASHEESVRRWKDLHDKGVDAFLAGFTTRDGVLGKAGVVLDVPRVIEVFPQSHPALARAMNHVTEA